MLDAEQNAPLLSGLDQLLSHIELAEKTYGGSATLRNVSPLVSRARGDFETAVYCLLSGHAGAAADSMRDVIEVELLLLDFATEPGRVPMWIDADEDQRRSKFGPARIRKRLQANGRDVSDEDYAAHSQILHVNPGLAPVGGKGAAQSAYSILVGLADVFLHGRRLLLAAEAFSTSAGIHTDLNPDDSWTFTKVERGLRGFLENMSDDDGAVGAVSARSP